MLLEDIGQYLQTQGIGTLGVDIFLGTQSDTPDNCITLFEYAGEPPDMTHDSKQIEKPGLQARVRNTSYQTGRTKIESVKNTLHCLQDYTANGTRYLFVQARQSPESLGRDENNRHEFVINFAVAKE